MTNNLKKNFIDDEIWILTFGGGFQRAKIYKKNTNDAEKKELRTYIKQYVRKLMKSSYAQKCPSSTTHSKNISTFSDDISKKFGKILDRGRFKIGIGQKILNLYLKYLWCLDIIPEPPHCPFDRIIISKLRLDVSWTKLDNIDQYKNLVDVAKSKAESKSLAEWELEVFSRR
jgi:hypothetical protein